MISTSLSLIVNSPPHSPHKCLLAGTSYRRTYLQRWTGPQFGNLQRRTNERNPQKQHSSKKFIPMHEVWWYEDLALAFYHKKLRMFDIDWHKAYHWQIELWDVSLVRDNASYHPPLCLSVCIALHTPEFILKQGKEWRNRGMNIPSSDSKMSERVLLTKFYRYYLSVLRMCYEIFLYYLM